MRKRHYEMTNEVRPGWTLPGGPIVVEKDALLGLSGPDRPVPARWKQPPHVAFANMNFDIDSVKSFTRTYGPPILDMAQLPEEPGEQFEVNMFSVGQMQDRLRRAWRARDAKALWFPRGGEELAIYYVAMTWSAPGMVIAPADVWTYMRLLLTRDIEAKLARMCASPKCPEPFFVAGRTNQDFCRNPKYQCGNAEMQRRWRERHG